VDDAFKIYSTAMNGLLGPGWWSSWPLATRHSVGDICSVKNGQLLQAGSLATLGGSGPTKASPRRDDLAYDSDGSVEVTFKAAGTTGPLFNALGEADAGAHIAFSRERSVFAVFTGLREIGLSQPLELARPLTELYLRREWEPDRVVVTHVLSAAASTVLIAAGAEAQVELRVGAAVGATVKIADLAGKVGLARSRHLGLEWLSGAEATPFCRVVGLRKSWRGKVDADFAPRQRVHGFAPADIPVRLINQAENRPDEVIAELTAGDDPSDGS
jgi:hypothetical protein